MKPTTDEQVGWYEPIAEGLWRTDLLFEVPRHMNAIHVVFVFGAVMDSVSWLYWAGLAHVIMVAATMLDPEWPKTLSDFFAEPNELEV